MKEKKSWPWIVLAILVVCIAVVCIILFAGKKKDPSANKPSQETTTEMTDSKDKDGNNGQNGGAGGNTGGQGEIGNNDTDLPYIDIPVDDTDSGQSPDGNGNGGGDNSGDNTGNNPGGDDIIINDGDIVLPMVP